MLSWTFPGVLTGVKPRSDEQAELIDRAEKLVSEGRKSGYFHSPVLSAGTSSSP